MNKIIKIWLVCVAVVAITLMLNNNAYAANGVMTGPEVVRGGDTITIVLTTDVAGALGVECALDYDKSVISLVSVKSGLPGWMAERNGNIIVAYDNELNNPTIGSNDAVVTFVFDVKDEVVAATPIKITLSNIVLSDGTKETVLPDVTYTNLVTKPLSKNNKLSSIVVKEGTISPEFKSSITAYNIGEVDFGITSLGIEAVTEDAGAKVEITGNKLKVGNNVVSIVVTAENGTQRVYTVSVKRKQDPLYVAGADAALRSIELSKGILSPKFSPDNTEYVVYVPYEVKGISAVGTPRDEKALGVTNATSNNLIEGENILKIICKAEDGTEKTYNIKVIRMPLYDSNAEEKETTTDAIEETTSINEQENTTVSNDETTSDSKENDKSDTNKDSDEKSENNSSNNIIWYIVWLLVGIVVGAVGCWLINKNRKSDIQ